MADEMSEAQWSNVMVVQRRTFLDIEVPYEEDAQASVQGATTVGLVRRYLSDSALHMRAGGGPAEKEAESDDEVDTAEPTLAHSLTMSCAGTTEDPDELFGNDDMTSVNTPVPMSFPDAVATEASEETSGGESVLNDDDCESVCSLSTDQEDQEDQEEQNDEVQITDGEGAAVGDAADPGTCAGSSWVYALWAPAAMGGVWGYSMQMAVGGAPEQYYEPYDSPDASSSTTEPALGTAVGRWADCDEDEASLPQSAYPEWHPMHAQMHGRGNIGADQNSLPLPHEWTTVIFKSLPIDWTRDSLTELLDAEGFCGDYDFVHVPVKFQDLTNLGYALVNCTSNSSADSVLRYFEGFRFSGGNQLATNWSQPNQGLAAHVERYRDSPMMHSSVPEQYKPGLFRDGVRLPFPAPTKNLRAPRVRRQKSFAL